jgi:polyisoprenoid-binding protein YceI
MRRSLIVAAVLLSGCMTTPATAPSAPAAPVQTALPLGAGASTAIAEQPAGAYALDGRHMSVAWKVRHAGVGIFVARFDTVSGALNLDTANPTASTLTVTVAANSVNTGVLSREGTRAFDEEIHKQAFGSAAHPEIKFVSRSIQRTGPTTGVVVGDLTLKGVTRPLTLQATFEGGRFVQFRGKQVIAFTARGAFNRKDFGASLSNPMADSFASDLVELDLAAEFIQQ